MEREEEMKTQEKTTITVWLLLLALNLILMIWGPNYVTATIIGCFIGGILIMLIEFSFRDVRRKKNE